MKALKQYFLAGTVLLLFPNCSSDDVKIEPDTISGNSPLVEVPADPTTPPADPPAPVDQPPLEDQASMIIYTDIEPDFISHTENSIYGLDLNNDQLVDYILKWNYDPLYEWLEINSNPGGQNGIISVAPWYSNPIPLNEGSEIFRTPHYSSEGLFYDTWGIFTIGDCFGGEPSCFYDWKGQGDRYLGLRLTINQQNHYGWARIQITGPAEWVVKDYAFNATPNKPVFAGRD